MQDVVKSEGLICVGDLNNNGDIDTSAETAMCTEAPQGNLCPISTIDCVGNYIQPICVSGAVFNPTTDRCEAIAVTSGGACTVVIHNNNYAANSAYTCPSGGTASGSTCTRDDSYSATGAYTCPSGGTLSGTSCITTSNYTASISSYSCPNGGTLSGTSCVTSGGYAAAAYYYCPNGATLQNGVCYTTNSTAAVSVSACPYGGQLEDMEGYYMCHVFNQYFASGGERVYYCLNRIDKPYKVGSNYYCPDGAHEPYLAPSGQNPYYCPNGGTLNDRTHFCVLTDYYYTPAEVYSCPAGWTLNGAFCNQINSFTAMASYSCPYGGTLNGTTCTTSGSYAAQPNYYCHLVGRLMADLHQKFFVYGYISVLLSQWRDTVGEYLP